MHIERIAAERKRQIEEEGFTHEHDAKYNNGELAWAATHWAMPEYLVISQSGGLDLTIYPEIFAVEARGVKFKSWGSGNRLHQLTYAGALIAAEIDRLQAEEAAKGGE